MKNRAGPNNCNSNKHIGPLRVLSDSLMATCADSCPWCSVQESVAAQQEQALGRRPAFFSCIKPPNWKAISLKIYMLYFQYLQIVWAYCSSVCKAFNNCHPKGSVCDCSFTSNKAPAEEFKMRTFFSSCVPNANSYCCEKCFVFAGMSSFSCRWFYSSATSFNGNTHSNTSVTWASHEDRIQMHTNTRLTTPLSCRIRSQLFFMFPKAWISR